MTADYEQPLAGGKLKLGYDWEDAPKITEQDTGNGSNGGPIAPDPNQQGTFTDVESENEAYASYERAFGKLTLLGGLRVEEVRLDLDQRALGDITHHAYPRLYPSLHLAYDLGSGRRLTASFSRRTNVPYSEQLDPLLSSSPTVLTAGNQDLRPGRRLYATSWATRTGRTTGSQTATLVLRGNSATPSASSSPNSPTRCFSRRRSTPATSAGRGVNGP